MPHKVKFVLYSWLLALSHRWSLNIEASLHADDVPPSARKLSPVVLPSLAR